MKGLRPAGAFLAAWLVLSPSAHASDSVTDRRAEIKASESRIADLQKRLGGLIAEMNSIEGTYVATSARLGISYIRLKEAEADVVASRTAFNERARLAYKRGILPQASVLLKVQSLGELLGVSRFLGGTLEADARAYEDLLAAQAGLGEIRIAVESERMLIQTSAGRLDSLREQIQSALESEQRVLLSAREELKRLEEARRRQSAAQRRSSGVSAAVEARRAARQIELDRKLAALLAWYAPGQGNEPFMPSKLKASGIVTGGLSSWYGPGFDGRRASSGATFRQEQLTAASLVLPFGTLLKVTYAGKSVVVVITDRGPYVDGRVLDLSMGAAQAIGLSGVKQVRMEIVVPTEPAPPFP